MVTQVGSFVTQRLAGQHCQDLGCVLLPPFLLPLAPIPSTPLSNLLYGQCLFDSKSFSLQVHTPEVCTHVQWPHSGAHAYKIRTPLCSLHRM
jgi:hypothetical protein